MGAAGGRRGSCRVVSEDEMMAMEKLDGAGQAQQAPTPARSFGLAHLEKDNYSYQQDYDDHDDVFSAEEERENQRRFSFLQGIEEQVQDDSPVQVSSPKPRSPSPKRSSVLNSQPTKKSSKEKRLQKDDSFEERKRRMLFEQETPETI